MPSIIALIPARYGSKRIPNKNIKKLGSHPLIAYAIQSAIDSKIFSRIIVSTENTLIAKIAQYYGAEIPFLRPPKYARDHSPDIHWVKDLFVKLKNKGEKYDYFSILRSTSPFRSSDTILRAYNEFLNSNSDSIRAIEKCHQHPYKMWKLSKNGSIVPLIKKAGKMKIDFHSKPYQSLPVIYSQNASLEIAKYHIPLKTNSISGNKIKAFFTDNHEGYDLNTEKDWVYALYLLETKIVTLPKIDKKPFEI